MPVELGPNLAGAGPLSSASLSICAHGLSQVGARSSGPLTTSSWQGNLQSWVAVFYGSCRSRNLAAGTLSFYSKKLSAFLMYCGDRGVQDLDQLGPDTIRDFLIQLQETGHRPGGMHCYFRALRTFLKWFQQEAAPEDWRNPIDRVRAPVVPLEPLDPVSVETIRAMLNTCTKGSPVGARDQSSLLFLLDTGSRLSEFLALNKADVDLLSGTVQIRAGKGRKPRNVYLGEKSRQTLRRYLRERADDSPALWLSRSGERLSDSGLRMMLRRRAEMAGVPAPSPHDFRRAFAIERWRAGVDILTISRLMGHSSLQVLNRYLKQVGEDLERAAKQSSTVDLNF